MGRALVLAASVVVALASCRDERAPSLRPADAQSAGATTSTVPAPRSSVPAARDRHRTVRPSTTDPSIDDLGDAHEVFVPSGARNGKLLVFLPGTNGTPSNVRRFLGFAADRGYLSLGLAYPDATAAVACGEDLECYGRMREAVIEGRDVSPLVRVSPANSIENRLVKLLRHLRASAPDEGWGAFLSGDQLAYGSIAFAGHSQGGGHAAFIAARHAVARVLMFSSVCDATNVEHPVPATWVARPHATPADRYYGFDNTRDMFASRVRATWSALGLDPLGRATVDDGSPPFGGAHELVTSAQGPSARWAHNSVIGDRAATGFERVWGYMLGP